MNNATRLAITNPLTLYRSLIATKHLKPDPEQHRLAIHLEKLYTELKDYTPPPDFQHRIAELTESLKPSAPVKPSAPAPNGASSLDPNIATPSGLYPRRGPRSFWATLIGRSQAAESVALTRILTDHEAAAKLHTPRGLMLHGPVGCGKSMLVDMFAASLPTQAKKRWHFGTFMLWVIRKLEMYRAEAVVSAAGLVGGEYSLLRLARELVQESPILFIDEFQMPDRMAAKTLSALMAVFFRLGGVLIATSNRLPDELAKAAGLEVDQGRVREGREEANREFKGFLELVRARCVVWEVMGQRDYRRDDGDDRSAPEFYGEWDGSETDLAIPRIVSLPASITKFQETAITVFGRKVPIPRFAENVSLWTFAELCSARLGSADYISLASTCDTFIILDVPVLTNSLKNEARRFITLLDALYESKCRLYISAAAPPDSLFFPDTGSEEEDSEKMMLAETFAEMHQDVTSPFRPNISSYSLAEDSLEDDPPNRLRREAMPELTEMERLERLGSPRPNFSDKEAFTGEDEKFAWKRASSRLWEMCSQRWWDTAQWTPVTERHWESKQEHEVEKITVEVQTSINNERLSEKMGETRQLNEKDDQVMYQHGGIRVEIDEDSPPRIQPEHVWGVQKWGKKAGAWGEGPEGLKNRDRDQT